MDERRAIVDIQQKVVHSPHAHCPLKGAKMQLIRVRLHGQQPAGEFSRFVL